MVIDGAPDRLRFAILAGIDTTHLPLKFGKLAYHVRGQIRLGQKRGPRGVRCHVARIESVTGDPGRQPFDPVSLGKIATKLGVEPERVEAFQATSERRPSIGFPEKTRIPQPGN